jgi:hypothetical protein
MPVLNDLMLQVCASNVTFVVASCNQKPEFCVCVIIVFERVLVGAGATHGTRS